MDFGASAGCTRMQMSAANGSTQLGTKPGLTHSQADPATVSFRIA